MVSAVSRFSESTAVVANHAIVESVAICSVPGSGASNFLVL